MPGIDEYRQEGVPTELLTFLGEKTSCKDRWRQVLSEADRITNKHLLTLEPGISKNQTDEMRSNITAATHKTHRLGASVTETAGRHACKVTIDGRKIWSGRIDSKLIADIKGPVGFRSDNGSFIFKLFVTDTKAGN